MQGYFFCKYNENILFRTIVPFFIVHWPYGLWFQQYSVAHNIVLCIWCQNYGVSLWSMRSGDEADDEGFYGGGGGEVGGDFHFGET